MTDITMTPRSLCLDKVEYRASWTYVGSDGYEFPVPPQVSVRFTGDEVRIALDIDDARTLFYALGVILVEHAVAEADSRGSWAVA